MAKTEYIWDELSDNVIEKYEGGSLSASYTHEPYLYGNLISQNRSGTHHYYHYDGRGDTVALTNDAGTVTDTKDYDAWGNVVASTGSTQTPYQFVGQKGYYGDAATGLAYVRARLYQPLVVRWVSVDPLETVDGPNLFTYAANNPGRMYDPSGTECSTADGIHFKPEAGSAHAWFEGTSGRGEGELGRWQSFFNLRWTANPDAFKGSGCCSCCCDNVGFVQVLLEATAEGRGAHWARRTGRIDGGVPYKYGGKANPHKTSLPLLSTSGDPCQKPPLIIAMFDAPGLNRSGFIYSLLTYSQSFETCVVCLEGCEEPKWSYKGFERGTMVSLDRMVIYGCMTWEHRFTWVSDDESLVTRYVNGRNFGTISLDKDQKDPTFYNVSLGKNGSQIELQHPSATFLSIVSFEHLLAKNTGKTPQL